MSAQYRRPTRPTLLLLLCCLLFAGCSSRHQLYDWGSYETSLQRMYADDGSFVLQEEIERLSHEIERSVEANRRIPPGKLAYLGYLYYQLGDTALARESFIREKTLFPESTVLMDRLIARLP